LGAVIDADDLELVGVRVYDPGKDGKDAGELAGRPTTGVPATSSRDEALAVDADVVLYMARVETDAEGCFRDVVDLLRAGKDVIATGSTFIEPHGFVPELAAEVDDAARAGGSRFVGVGLYPGFWGEVVAPVLARLSLRTGRITIRESLSYAGYPSTELLFDRMGYGHPADEESPAAQAGVAFLSTATLVAKALGARVESVETFRETRTTDRELRVAAGIVPAGTVAAIKFGVRAACGPFDVAVEHVTWMDDDAAGDWADREGYEIEFDGAPSLRCSLVLGTAGENRTEMGCLATAMHAVHAIPAVRAARPGLLDVIDLATIIEESR
jgi:hypothetical protein